jgi:hypothetical protein
MRLAALLLLLAALGPSCKANRQAEVAGIWIAQADSLLPVPEDAPVLTLKPGEPLGAPPEGKDIRLAIARETPWSEVRTAIETLRKAERTPHLLVASERKVGGLSLSDEMQGAAIDVIVMDEGKLCVAPPESREAKCVQRPDRKHIDRAYTRELVREAVKGYGLRNAVIEVPPNLQWADLVRAVDGARTCCFEKEVRVRLKN